MLPYLPPLGNVGFDLDLEVQFGCYDSRLTDGVHHRMIVYEDHTAWRYLLLKKDLHPLYLKWFLLLQEVEYEVCCKGGIIVVKSPFSLVSFQNDDRCIA